MVDEPWYRDAIIYEVHVRSFFDSDGDGIGDIRGLTRRLDYIEELGVTALWLLPFYPSPLKDDGYDIAGYTEIHPDYGTIADFRQFLADAHRRGLRVITELVLNHTSDQHPWFQRARRAPEGSVERNFYVWSDTPERYRKARVIFPELKDSNWTFDPVAGQYYWHRFYDHQPDLNYDNPAVRRAIYDVVDFWLEMGIDGLRLDAITYLYEREGTDCESLPETHQFLRELRSHIDNHYSERVLLAEANQWPEDAVDYFGDGDECHMTFHFPLMPRLFMGVEMEDRQPIIDILQQTPELPEGCQWALFLRNHDELTLEMVTDEERDFMYRTFAPEIRMRVNLGIRRRLAPMLQGDPLKIRLMYGLLFSLPGTPVVYYGDEIGMGDNYHLGDRDGVRTPMQWSADRNAGFSRANPQSLFLPVITDPAYHYLSTNVETQENNPSSLLRWVKRRIGLRKRTPALARGDLEIVPCTNHRVLAFVRTTGGDFDDVLVVINLSGAAQHLHLDLSDHAGLWPVETWGQTQFPPVRSREAHRYALSVGAYEFFWFRLADQPLQRDIGWTVPRPAEPLEVRQEWTEVFEGRLRPHFERHLWNYLSTRHWFNPRSRTIDSLEAGERTRLRWEKGLTVICLVEVRFLDGDNELYVLPLEYNPLGDGGESSPVSDEAVVTRIDTEETGEGGQLYDATHDLEFASALLGFIRREWSIDGLEGTIRGHWLDKFQQLAPEQLDELSAEPIQSAGTHTSVRFGDQLVMKFLRRLERGRSLDVELGKYLLEHNFEATAPFMGHLDYHRGRWEPTTLVTLHQYVDHETDGWTWYCEHVRSQLDLSEGGLSTSPSLNSESLMVTSPEQLAPEGTDSHLLDALRRLGRRTAEMHRILAKGKTNSGFEPEPLTSAYERARYHWARNLTARTFRLLRHRLSDLQVDRDLARWVLEHDEAIIERFQALVDHTIGGLRLRIHGDYHLKELLVVDGDFTIIDFEGHPWLPPGERRIKRSPLRDVASMIRSLHSACICALRRHWREDDIRTTERLRTRQFHRLQRFFAACSSAVLEQYLSDRNQMAFLPPEQSGLITLLDALRLEKAIHQLGHDLERNCDPSVALMAVATLLETSE